MKTYTKKIITSALLLTLVISANASNHKHHAGVIFGSANMHKHESSFVGFEYQHNISAQFAVGITSEKMNGYDPKDSISVNTLSAFWYPIPHLKFGIGIGEEKVSGKHNYKASVSRGTISYEYPVEKISIAPTLTIDSIGDHTVTAFGIAFSMGF